MDPLSASPLPLSGGIRPAQALQGDLASILRQGRIVAGEVLDLLDGGTIVIGLAGQRVQAENHVDLAPGDRFLARVEYSDGALVLRLAGSQTEPDDALLTALRGLAGSELDLRSILELLGESSSSPRNGPAVFLPEEGGAALAALLRKGGLFHEGVIRAVAADDATPWAEDLALDALASRILAEAGLSGAEERGALLALLREALATNLADLGAGAGAAHSLEVGLQLRAELVRLLGTHALDPARGLLRAYFAGLDAPAIEHAGWLPWLALLLGERLQFSERGLRRRALVQLLQEDFKARLLERMQSGASEPEREAAGRALRAIEAEQLRNLARARLGEPLHVGFLLPEGARAANAHLFVSARGEGKPEAEPDGGQRGERVTVAVEFSGLGALRAEILLKPGRLQLRLSAASAATVALLQGQLEALGRQLCAPGRELHMSVVQQEPDKADVGGADLAYLREHHLMDLSG
jgi:hypothetical protein